jgi:uncharacterized membrane protein YeiH
VSHGTGVDLVGDRSGRDRRVRDLGPDLTAAVRQRMDVVGVFSVAFVSAFGGGTLRDVLLDRRPLFWVEHQEYVWLVLAMTLAAPLLLRAVRHQLVDKVTEVTDAFGLGLFAISPPPHGFLGHAFAVF